MSSNEFTSTLYTLAGSSSEALSPRTRQHSVTCNPDDHGLDYHCLRISNNKSDVLGVLNVGGGLRVLSLPEVSAQLLTLIYLLTAIGLSPGGSTHLHTNNNRTTQITNEQHTNNN